MNATLFLRSVHAWFFHWERVVPSLYRVVATGLAALATAIVLLAVGMHPLLAGPVALLGWVALAVAQEHDERVLLPPDGAFVAALVEAVATQPLHLSIETAHGPRRARPQGWDTMVVLTPPGIEGHPLGGMFISLERAAGEGWMRLDVIDDAPGAFEPIDERLRKRGESALADRIERAQSPSSDAHSIASALRAAYW
jgi:multisubunit Na+/H+ antiporter MnhB subunit